MPTISISSPNGSKVDVEAFSPISLPLVITRSLEDNEEHLYKITHARSGFSAVSSHFHEGFTLPEARCVLDRLLSVADWRKSPEQLEPDGPRIAARIRAIVTDCTSPTTQREPYMLAPPGTHHSGSLRAYLDDVTEARMRTVFGAPLPEWDYREPEVGYDLDSWLFVPTHDPKLASFKVYARWSAYRIGSAVSDDAEIERFKMWLLEKLGLGTTIATPSTKGTYRFTLKIRRAMYDKFGAWEVVGIEEPVDADSIVKVFGPLADKTKAIEEARRLAHAVTKESRPQVPTRILDESGECLLVVQLKGDDTAEETCPPSFWLRNPTEPEVPRALLGVGSLIAIAGGVVVNGFASFQQEYEADKSKAQWTRVWGLMLLGVGAGLGAAFWKTHATTQENPRSEFIIKSPYETVVVSTLEQVRAVGDRLGELVSIQEVFPDGSGRWILPPVTKSSPLAEYARRVHYWLVVSHYLSDKHAARLVHDNLGKIEEWLHENAPEWIAAKQLAQLMVGQRFSVRRRRPR